MRIHLPEIVPTLKEASFSPDSIMLNEAWGLQDHSTFPGLVEKYATVLGLAPLARPHKVLLQRDDAMQAEAYRLAITPEEVKIQAASRRGFLYALSTLGQLKEGPYVPIGTVYDYPRLPVRGIHLMFESLRLLGASEALALLASAAKLKLNTILLEFGDRFPFQRHPVVCAPSALTVEEVRRLVAQSRDLDLEIIPLQQSLGHLRYLLRHEEYAFLREEQEHQDQMCPLHEGSLGMFTELAEELLSLLGECRFFHIGADETRQLGVCPRCRAAAETHGKGWLYLHHINKVCAWLDKQGVTPMLWDDILCAHPHLIEHLDARAWIMYWDYWTTHHPSPHIVARYNPHNLPGVIVHDRRWQEAWKYELPEVARNTLEVFSEAVDLEQRLESEFQQVFGDYLGEHFPKYLRSFPYLEYYQAHGRRVLGAPTCSGNTSEWLSLPDFPRYGHNITTFADRCREAQAEGIVTTAWYNRPPELLNFGLLATAQSTW